MSFVFNLLESEKQNLTINGSLRCDFIGIAVPSNLIGKGMIWFIGAKIIIPQPFQFQMWLICYVSREVFALDVLCSFGRENLGAFTIKAIESWIQNKVFDLL